MPEHLLFSPLAWCFVPLMQGGWMVWVARRFAGASAARSLVLYYHGHFPWLALLMLMSGACLFVSEPWLTLGWFIKSGALGGLALVATVWCGVLTYAMFRRGFGLSRRQSGWATAAHYGGAVVLFVSWFLWTGQLLPLWGLM
jgi:hypothetical protein